MEGIVPALCCDASPRRGLPQPSRIPSCIPRERMAMKKSSPIRVSILSDHRPHSRRFTPKARHTRRKEASEKRLESAKGLRPLVLYISPLRARVPLLFLLAETLAAMTCSFPSSLFELAGAPPASFMGVELSGASADPSGPLLALPLAVALLFQPVCDSFLISVVASSSSRFLLLPF